MFYLCQTKCSVLKVAGVVCFTLVVILVYGDISKVEVGALWAVV